MGLAVVIITVGAGISLMFLVVFIDPGDVHLVYLYPDLLNCESCGPLESRRIDRFDWCALPILWFGGWCDLLELPGLRIADKLLPVIIILIMETVVIPSGFSAPFA